ncbi:hypothetical protein F2Q70_00003113 [Brassica cretica]|uniref:PRA1 family protein n=1 Tax=Brassica cretica TaxID=69181 RepID=A0A8S9IUG7_BRACR|nr:hypothetical protein F2Q70_00003113 [Brassica cretica]
MNLHTLQQLLHHHTQTLQLIWLTVPGSWNSLPIALRLSLLINFGSQLVYLLGVGTVPFLGAITLLVLIGFSARLKQSAPVVPAAREQPAQQHPAELGWSAAFEASVVASVATEQ